MISRFCNPFLILIGLKSVYTAAWRVDCWSIDEIFSLVCVYQLNQSNQRKSFSRSSLLSKRLLTDVETISSTFCQQNAWHPTWSWRSCPFWCRCERVRCFLHCLSFSITLDRRWHACTEADSCLGRRPANSDAQFRRVLQESNSVHWKLTQQFSSLTVIFLLTFNEYLAHQNNSKYLKNFRHRSTCSMLSQNLSDRSFSTGVNLYNTSKFEASHQSIERSGWWTNCLKKTSRFIDDSNESRQRKF